MAGLRQARGQAEDKVKRERQEEAVTVNYDRIPDCKYNSWLLASTYDGIDSCHVQVPGTARWTSRYEDPHIAELRKQLYKASVLHPIMDTPKVMLTGVSEEFAFHRGSPPL